MVDKKLSEFSQITPAEISKLICLFLDQNNVIKNGVVDFATLDALLAHKAGTETFTGNKTFSGDTVFSGNATFNNTVNANVSGSSGSCTGNSATATKATQDASGNNIANTYATKTELSNKVDLNLNNMNPSATSKQTIVGWGMPDYSTAISLSGQSSFTATYKCWIVGWSNISGGGEQIIYVNGVEVAREAGDYANLQIPLDVGDVLTTNAGNFTSLSVAAMKGINNA